MTLIRRRGRVTGLRVPRDNPSKRHTFRLVDRFMENARNAALAAVTDFFAGDGGYYSGPLTRVYLSVTAALNKELGRRDKANPPLVVFGNPQTMLSDDVVEIRYKHKEDGQYYEHSFSRKQVRLLTGGAESKTAVLQRVDGKPLIGDY